MALASDEFATEYIVQVGGTNHLHVERQTELRWFKVLIGDTFLQFIGQERHDSFLLRRQTAREPRVECAATLVCDFNAEKSVMGHINFDTIGETRYL